VSGKIFAPSPLVAAIRAGRLSGVVSALDDGADIEEADIHGCSGLPLRTACFEGDIAIVRELLRYGATPNAMATDGPGAPLRLALRSGHPEVAALLLQYGAELPSGIDLPASVTESHGKLPLPTDDAPVPRLPEKPEAEAASASPAEETHPYLDLAIEEVDVNGCYGTDTNLLTMELLRSNVEPDSPAEPETAPAGFWQTRRSKN
jgi:hypothetical protein